MQEESAPEELKQRLEELEKELAERRWVEEERDRILTLSQDLICISGTDGFLRYVNPAWENVLGYTSEELLSRPLLDFIHPDDHEKNEQEVVKLSSGQQTIDFENRYIHKDGSIRTITWRATPAPEDKMMYCIGRDSTDHKWAKDELRKSEARYRLLAENATDVIWTMDLNLRFTYVSPSVTRLRGYSVEEAMSQKYEETMTSSSLEVVNRILTMAFDKRNVGHKDLFNPVTLEVEQTCKDGSTVWVEATTRLLPGPDGQPVGFLGMTRDISKRKQAEKETQKLALAVKHSSELVNLASLDGDMTFLNEAGGRMLGIDPEEVKNINILQVIPDHLLGLIEDILPILIGGDTWEGDLQYLNLKTGELTDAHAMLFTVKDPDTGEQRFLANVSQDITERKRTEREKGILEEQLRQAQKMEAIGTLAGGIAHDFNNILGAITGYTELLLLDAQENTRLRYNSEEILIAAKRARDLVKQILAYSRQSEEERKPVDVNTIVEEVLRLLRASLPATIELRKNMQVESGTILADPSKVHQVLMNLCTNAAQAMTRRGGVLGVSLTEADLDSEAASHYPELSPGRYLKLTVSDTGDGMEKEVIDRIFDPFFTTKAVGKGTGMGLSVAYGIIMSYEGAIRVESDPEKGSTVHVFLPSIKADVTVLEPTIIEKLPVEQARILFVDDEKNLVDVGKQMLEHLGYEVTSRTSSVEALEIFRAEPQAFDLIITDMAMPTMSGVDLAKEMLGIRPNIPIILCTGFSESINAETAREMGIREILMKPLLLNDLAKITRRFLGQEEEQDLSRKARVLVADDDAQMRGLLRQTLELEGYEVMEASNGKEAITLYHGSPTDIIITDLIMPEKEGMELITELRSDFPEVKIIAISGGGRLGAEEYLPMAKGLGAVRTFSKPFNREDLLAAVQEILSSR